MKILIAEDDFIARKVICKFVQSYGEIEVVENGQEALNLFKANHDTGKPFDLICLDIMMPKLNGHETLLAIREFEERRQIRPNHICKILMTTALDDSQNILKSFNNHCDGYITKPYSFDKMAEEMTRMAKLIEDR